MASSLPVAVGAECNPLDGCRAIAEAIHLLARQDDADRAFERGAPSTARTTWYCGRKPEPKAPPTKATRPAPVRASSRRRCKVALHVLHALRFVVDVSLPPAVPDDRRGEQLHRIVVLDRDVIVGLVSHVGSGEGLVGVASRLRRLVATLCPRSRRACSSVELVFSSSYSTTYERGRNSAPLRRFRRGPGRSAGR